MCYAVCTPPLLGAKVLKKRFIHPPPRKTQSSIVQSTDKLVWHFRSPRLILISPRNFPNSSRGNFDFLGRKGKILRKNQMKLRKNQMISSKNSPFLREEIKNISRDIWKFIRRDWDEPLILYYNASALPARLNSINLTSSDLYGCTDA